MAKGAFVLSLDFELLWGVFDKVDHQTKKRYFQNTREVIPEILKLFAVYDIHCTWATVGMLFNQNWEEWKKNIPLVRPEYEKQILSAYDFGNGISSEESEFLCFGTKLIQEIQATPHQEIGTHTYSHYYCLEAGQNLLSFKADLDKCIEIAKGMGIELKSLVFPRNQFNIDYLKTAKEMGIQTVRSNPSNWYWEDTQNDTLSTKIFRTGDAYLGANDKSYPFQELEKEEELPLAQKASRLLRPYSPNKFLNSLKLKRILSEMTYAAKNNQIYHLWWHPHNFGNNPQENLADLEIILKHYERCNREFHFQSCNMIEINNFLNEK